MRFAVCLFLALAILGGGTPARAGLAEFTDRGKIDFDTLLELLNPYGKWTQTDGLWAFTPTDHGAPYTSGRWLYTEYGWYWKGSQPHSWATEHYGYWKRDDNHVWSWYPGATWLPQIVEMRSTPTHIGWRSAEVDANGSFVEEPADRYAKVDEWTFVTRAQFCGPITPGIVADTDTASRQMDDAVNAMHSYVTYRAITRPGPHPADFLTLGRNGGMFPPTVLRDATSQTPAPPPPPPLPGKKLAGTAGTSAPSPDAAANATAQPPVLQDDNGAPADMRQVSYWITMSLPTYWTKPPERAEPNQVYIYRPDLYQDLDGIERRITLWHNPKARSSLADMRDVLTHPKSAASAGAATGPGVPARPVASGQNPFQSPFDDSYHSALAPAVASTSHSSSKNPGQPAPSGLGTPLTNAPPTTAP